MTQAGQCDKAVAATTIETLFVAATVDDKGYTLLAATAVLRRQRAHFVPATIRTDFVYSVTFAVDWALLKTNYLFAATTLRRQRAQFVPAAIIVTTVCGV